MSPFESLKHTRRELLRLTAGALTGQALFREALAQTASVQNGDRYFYFAVIADTHIIDPFYKGPEGSPEDTDSIFKTSQRLVAARDFINTLQPAMERVFLVGDYFHNYPSPDWDFYFKNKTRVDLAKEITDRFHAPVHPGFGNHDYDVPDISRDFSHRLFKEKFQLDPYYSVEYKGFRFIHLNNFLGETWNPSSKGYNLDTGSLGEQQLNWFEAQLADGTPAFVFIHYPLRIVAQTEIADYGLARILKKNRGVIQRFVSGHWHRWSDLHDTFGPPHLVIAATRYDPNAYMLVEVDRRTGTHRWINAASVEWNTHYAKPYRA